MKKESSYTIVPETINTTANEQVEIEMFKVKFRLFKAFGYGDGYQTRLPASGYRPLVTDFTQGFS
jgi:hypothetical protein